MEVEEEAGQDPLVRFIREIPDFPREGILFRDITPLLASGPALARAVREMSAPFRESGVELVAGLEARGFILGALVAGQLGAGFVPLRKAGKLPGPVDRVAYALEYGEASLEVSLDVIEPGTRVLLVDDLLATGGTAEAGRTLIAGRGATLVGCSFLIELSALGGRRRLEPGPVHALIEYPD